MPQLAHQLLVLSRKTAWSSKAGVISATLMIDADTGELLMHLDHFPTDATAR